MAGPHGRTGCLEGEKRYIGIEPRHLNTFTIDLAEEIIEISDRARKIRSSRFSLLFNEYAGLLKC